jgi:hypothetical protein
MWFAYFIATNEFMGIVSSDVKTVKLGRFFVADSPGMGDLRLQM